jgi:hypothetical protein
MDEIEKALKQKLTVLEEGLNGIYIIHYSCESFLDVKQGSPTIVSIAIKELCSGQILTFALSDFVTEEHMLESYFQFLNNNREKLFVHWNMNDTVYGFEAIRNRYKQLTKKQGISIPGGQLFDLDDLVEKKYGKRYAAHPKLYNLAQINRYSILGFRTGKDEAELFKQSAYFENKLSTIRKVNIIANILEDLLSDKLLTNNRKFATIIRRIEENSTYKLLAIIVTVLTLVLIIWAILQAVK